MTDVRKKETWRCVPGKGCDRKKPCEFTQYHAPSGWFIKLKFCPYTQFPNEDEISMVRI